LKVKELFQRYPRVLEAWEKAIEYTRRLTLLEYERWSAGVYEAEDYLDWRDKLYKIRVKLELKKSGVVADFTETDRQVDKPINAVYGVTFAAISFAVRCALGRGPSKPRLLLVNNGGGSREDYSEPHQASLRRCWRP
jgi:N-methylhydantoinase B